MVYKNLIYEKDGHLAYVKMNRPEVLNALNSETFYELHDLFSQIEKDNKLRVVIVTGEGRAFVAGADIAELTKMSQLEAREFSQLGQKVFNKIKNLGIPVIAAVNGFALGGGCELAMSCDIRWASEKAKFGQPEVSLGITPGFAGTQRLARLCSPAIAKELILTGNIIDAKRAMEIGLVTNVVALEKLLDEVKGLAEKIASQGPVAVKLAKQAINRGFDSNFETAGAYESEVFGLCFSHPESKEGLSAFLEKRKPSWQ
ncbi:enoyl-CoA hydratase/isomerase family protein [candidate division WOR-3 bacterium]|nr:enoyl-CoA hydratase/isomerase family protein [candidate division WOR-3 bacterium]